MALPAPHQPEDGSSTGETNPTSPQDNVRDSEEFEWTHVTSKSRRRGARRGGKKGRHDLNLKQLSETPRASDFRSVADIDAEYRRIRARWESGPCCGQLRTLMTAHISGRPTLSRAVNLGVGTFDPADGGWEAKRTSFTQLAAFLIMVEELEKTSGSKIECCFQDPIFAQSDKDFLVSLGHRVVESPTGFELIDDNTLLYGLHLYRPIYVSALEKALPAVFVGTGWDTWDTLSVADGLENMEKMEKTYYKAPFPKDSSGSAFSSTCLYWKPVAQKQEQQGTTDKPTAEDKVPATTQPITLP